MMKIEISDTDSIAELFKKLSDKNITPQKFYRGLAIVFQKCHESLGLLDEVKNSLSQIEVSPEFKEIIKKLYHILNEIIECSYFEESSKQLVLLEFLTAIANDLLDKSNNKNNSQSKIEVKQNDEFLFFEDEEQEKEKEQETLTFLINQAMDYFLKDNSNLDKSAREKTTDVCQRIFLAMKNNLAQSPEKNNSIIEACKDYKLCFILSKYNEFHLFLTRGIHWRLRPIVELSEWKPMLTLERNPFVRETTINPEEKSKNGIPQKASSMTHYIRGNRNLNNYGKVSSQETKESTKKRDFSNNSIWKSTAAQKGKSETGNSKTSQFLGGEKYHSVNGIQGKVSSASPQLSDYSDDDPDAIFMFEHDVATGRGRMLPKEKEEKPKATEKVETSKPSEEFDEEHSLVAKKFEEDLIALENKFGKSRKSSEEWVGSDKDDSENENFGKRQVAFSKNLTYSPGKIHFFKALYECEKSKNDPVAKTALPPIIERVEGFAVKANNNLPLVENKENLQLNPVDNTSLSLGRAKNTADVVTPSKEKEQPADKDKVDGDDKKKEPIRVEGFTIRRN